MDRYRVRADRSEGITKASELRILPQISAKPNPGAEIRNHDVGPQERTGRGPQLRKSRRAARSATICFIRISTARVLMVARVAAWSLSTTVPGVPLGKKAASQFEASESINPCSCAVA